MTDQPALTDEFQKAFDHADAIRRRQADAYPQRLWQQLDRIEVLLLDIWEVLAPNAKESGTDGMPDLPAGDPGGDGGGARPSAP